MICFFKCYIFKNRSFLASLKKKLLLYLIKNKKTLEYFIYISIKNLVIAIINKLKKINKFRSAFKISNNIIFKNYPNIINNNTKKVIT